MSHLHHVPTGALAPLWSGDELQVEGTTMSLINEYAMQVMAEGKRQDFLAEVARDRLARIALQGHRPWWRRLFTPPGTERTAREANGVRPDRAGSRKTRIGAHRVAR
jgi:hypothetical protein